MANQILPRTSTPGPKHPANTFRLLTFLLYGSGFGMQHLGGFLVEITDFKQLYIPTGMDSRSSRPALKQLEKMGYISDLELKPNYAKFLVRQPRITQI